MCGTGMPRLLPPCSGGARPDTARTAAPRPCPWPSRLGLYLLASSTSSSSQIPSPHSIGIQWLARCSEAKELSLLLLGGRLTGTARISKTHFSLLNPPPPARSHRGVKLSEVHSPKPPPPFRRPLGHAFSPLPRSSCVISALPAPWSCFFLKPPWLTNYHHPRHIPHLNLVQKRQPQHASFSFLPAISSSKTHPAHCSGPTSSPVPSSHNNCNAPLGCMK